MRDTLPIDAHLPRAIEALREHRTLVLRAPTGAGKTTRLPPALLPEVDGRVIVVQPRRVAARAAARRMAQSLGVELGEEVGYHVRFDRRASDRTRLLVVTDGVFLRILQGDPFLEGVGAVLLDEFHERRLNLDLALALTRQVQLEASPSLWLVVMSATLDPAPIAAYLDDAPSLETRGRAYPVEIQYDPDNARRTLSQHTAASVRRALDLAEGDLLVFLPGVAEIQRTAEALSALAAERRLDVRVLHGRLSPEKQDAALAPGERRRVILSTNIAETSLTIEGVRVVVDSGYAKVLRFDPGCGLDRLERARISRAAAEQRAGRAGRTSPGVCLRLWSQNLEQTLASHDTPEIQRVDLAQTALQLLDWGERDLARFAWFEPPPDDALPRALEQLRQLGALDPRGGLSSLGREMAQLPVAPRLARLLIEGARLGVPKLASLAAATLSTRDPFGKSPRYRARSDVFERAQALAQSGSMRRWRPRHPGAIRELERVARQLSRLAPRAGRAARDPEEALCRALLTAFPDRVARRREVGSRRALMVGGVGLELVRESLVEEPELFVAVHLDAGRRGEHAQARVWLASGVEPGWLDEALLSVDVEVRFDPARQRVVAEAVTRYIDLVIRARPAPLPEHDPRVAACLEAAARDDLDAALGLDTPRIAQWLLRVRCLRGWMPELDLPDLDRDGIAALLPGMCLTARSFDELRRGPLLAILEASLSRAQQKALARDAPTHLDVPGRRRVPLGYQEDGPPVLATRIQDLYGCPDTPRVAGGRIPVLLHLLAPNRRPQQITQDLASFWRNTYPQLRKELRARYAKHAWPEDPLARTPRD